MPLLLDLLASDGGIFVQLLIHIGLPRPPPLCQLLHQPVYAMSHRAFVFIQMHNAVGISLLTLLS